MALRIQARPLQSSLRGFSPKYPVAWVFAALFGVTAVGCEKGSKEEENGGIGQAEDEASSANDEDSSDSAEDDDSDEGEEDSSESEDESSSSDEDENKSSEAEDSSDEKDDKDKEKGDDKKDNKDSGGGGGDGEVPADIEYCKPVAEWDPAWSKLEQEVLEITNKRRAEGADCGIHGKFDPAPPLEMLPSLRCSARAHSKDMADNNFFEHVNQAGEPPSVRMKKAGHHGYGGENIAAGSPDAAGTMKQWMDSDGHCSNIMNKTYKTLGVGYAPGGNYHFVWTQNFGS